MRLLLTIVLLLLSTVDANAATHARRLTVLTYNIKGLPDLITKMDSNRFRDIGLVLAERRKQGTAPDIVLIQEAFVPRTKELGEAAGYPHVARGPLANDLTENGKSQGTIYSAGLYVLSEFPIVATKKVAYDLKFCAEADCGSNKGAMLAVIEIPGLPKPLMVFNTHAQAIKKYDSLREKQFEIFNRFIAKNRGDEPFFIGGDFNSRPIQSSYSKWEQLTSTVAVGSFCIKNSSICLIDPKTDVKAAWEDAVDHIFFSQVHAMGGITLHPVSLLRNFGEPIGGRVLSDHLGYETTFEVTWSD